MLRERLFSIFCIAMLLASNVSAAVLSAPAYLQAPPDNSPQSDIETAVAQGYVCRLSGQSDLDGQRLLNLLNDGFVGENISSGEKPPENREYLDNNKLFVPIDNETAVKTELAGAKIEPREIQHLIGDSFSGPFSVGMVLDDTIRIGRCENLKDKNLPCPVTEKSLQFRNDGEGIQSDFKSAWTAIKNAIPALKDKNIESLGEEDYKAIRGSLGLPDANSGNFDNALALSDENSDELIEYKRKLAPLLQIQYLPPPSMRFQGQTAIQAPAPSAFTRCLTSTTTRFSLQTWCFPTASPRLCTGLRRRSGLLQ